MNRISGSFLTCQALVSSVRWLASEVPSHSNPASVPLLFVLWWKVWGERVLTISPCDHHP